MTQSTLPDGTDSLRSLLAECNVALNRVASYRLPAALNKRLRWLSENKERLSQAEREELLASVEFAEERTIEKLQARAVLERLHALYPDLACVPS